jgi:hypothetical protein
MNFWRTHIALPFPISCVYKLQFVHLLGSTLLLVLFGCLLSEQPHIETQSPIPLREEKTSHHNSNNTKKKKDTEILSKLIKVTYYTISHHRKEMGRIL